MRQIFSDEVALLFNQITSVSEHPVKIVDTKVELRPPVKLDPKNPSWTSQLSDLSLEQNCRAKECFPVVVAKDDLQENMDVSDLPLGKYVITWRREDEDEDEESDLSRTPEAVTTFDLQSVKVLKSSLSASATLPAFGVVRTPLTLK